MASSRQATGILTLSRGPGVGTRFDIGAAPVTIGRQDQCEVQVPGTWVSRRHARIAWTGTGYIVEDLGSTNGTFVNGERVSGPRALRPGDRLQLGEQVEFAFDARLAAPVPKETALPSAAPPQPYPSPVEPLLEQAPQPGTQVCPKCESLTPEGETHCVGCGYEFATGNEAVGPFTFQFPAVESAYKPSGIGTGKGSLLMIVFGLVAAIVLGPLIYVAHGIIAQIAAFLIGLNICLSSLAGMVVYFLGYVFAALIAGALVGTAVGRGAISGKSRNAAAAQRIALVLGLVCFGAFLGTYFAVLGMDEGLDSWVDFLKLGWNLFAVPAGAYMMADQAIKDTPFCEECQEFMKKTELKNRPIRQEKSLMAVLNAGALDRISDFPPDATSTNFCKITVWSCDCERGWGFVHMNTTQKRISVDKSGKRTENSQTRMVFSARFTRPQLAPLLS
ncbi:MAG: FHA domain-containing protein [Anaerolineae bacterium]|jgi:hypothetical protein